MARRTAILFGAGADADDVVQEALVSAYRALGRFREDGSFRPWLLKIVANETHNLLRARRRRSAREQTSALLSADLLAASAAAADPVGLALAGERQACLLAAVRGLTERHRLVVTCRYLLDLDETETASVLGWPRGTVKSRLHRALRRLRTELDAGADDTPAKEASHANG